MILDKRVNRVVPDIFEYERGNLAERSKIIMPRNQFEPLQTFSTCPHKYGDENVSPQQS
jgi:hypothetical protein